MWKYIIKRLLLIIPILFGVSLLIFTIMYFTPGNPGEIMTGGTATQEVVDEINHELGYDQPFLTQYLNYIKDVVFHFDFGTSWTTKLSVTSEIMSRLPRTITLAAVSMIFTALVGISVGILSAVKQYSIVDYICSVLSMLFSAVPSFWIGMSLLVWIAMQNTWFPINGVETWRGYILPCLALTLCNSAPLMRLTRSTMLETIRSDYIRTARAKGAKACYLVPCAKKCTVTSHHCYRKQF